MRMKRAIGIEATPIVTMRGTKRGPQTSTWRSVVTACAPRYPPFPTEITAAIAPWPTAATGFSRSLGLNPECSTPYWNRAIQQDRPHPYTERNPVLRLLGFEVLGIGHVAGERGRELVLERELDLFLLPVLVGHHEGDPDPGDGPLQIGDGDLEVEPLVGREDAGTDPLPGGGFLP